MNFILASASPRRRELFSLTGWSADVTPTHVPEQLGDGEGALAYVLRLAASKAGHAARRVQDESYLVIAADTIVVFEDHILEKPSDAGEACEMLEMLRGRVHTVYTAMSVVEPFSGKGTESICSTVVPMRNYARAEVCDYVESGSPLDKAGAYGIQDRSFSPVDLEMMDGCFANVMGLPLCHLLVLLRTYGVRPDADVPAACQQYTHYRCPVYAGILGGAPCKEPR